MLYVTHCVQWRALPDILWHRDSLSDASIVREYTMSTAERKDQIAASLRNLVTAYTKAMAHLEETLAGFCQEPGLGEIESFYEPLLTRGASATDSDDGGQPVADKTLLSIRWQGKTCFFGNTLPFRFFERLARRPN
jgi:hypothetical protein